MNNLGLKNIAEGLLDTFLKAGEVSLDLRRKGLTKEIKSDNTPVSNGDLEVNRLITKKLLELTPDIPIVSEESSHNKSTKNLIDFSNFIAFTNLSFGVIFKIWIRVIYKHFLIYKNV